MKMLGADLTNILNSDPMSTQGGRIIENWFAVKRQKQVFQLDQSQDIVTGNAHVSS